MGTIKHLFDRNREWAAAIKVENPEFFSSLSKQQNPEYLWIGCSDSRVPANQIVNMPPGEVFVHRNIANVVVHSDLNCLSVIQYAVEILMVEHIVVCGHYGCGGVRAAMDDKQYGLLDSWLSHIRDVKRFNEDRLKNLSAQEQFDLLCELNVQEQFAHVCNTSVVRNAWEKGQKLTVHGWIYSIENGILHSLSARDATGELPAAV
ncbi:MAG: carbonate dehydratase [Gammaproteobacteria bacterium]|nr:carbonate dehydratase [Gammaproteobacteria bacterium]